MFWITFHRHRRRNLQPGHHILCYAISSKHYHMMLVQGWQKFDKVYPPSQVSTTGKHSKASCSCNKTLLLPLLRNMITFSWTYENAINRNMDPIYISILFVCNTFFQQNGSCILSILWFGICFHNCELTRPTTEVYRCCSSWVSNNLNRPPITRIFILQNQSFSN